jgi:hypothetical protein
MRRALSKDVHGDQGGNGAAARRDLPGVLMPPTGLVGGIEHNTVTGARMPAGMRTGAGRGPARRANQ